MYTEAYANSLFSSLITDFPTLCPKGFATYLTYLNLRDLVTCKRIKGETHNLHYFNTYRSCQNRRYMDRESQLYILARKRYTGYNPVTDAMLHLVFRKNSTYQQLKERLGVFPGDLLVKGKVETVSRVLATIEKPFTGAYVVPPVKGITPKYDGWLSLFENNNFEQLSEIKNAKQAYEFLIGIDGLGQFLAMQFSTEIGWLDCVQYGGNEFVLPGNGAIRGLKKLGLTGKQATKFIYALVEKTVQTDVVHFRPFTLMDIQNTMCEFDKFTRWLGTFDNQGRDNQKRKYTANPTPIKEFETTNKLQGEKYYRHNFLY